MGTVETSLRPKSRPKETSLRPRLRPSEEEMADIEAGRTIERANRLKKLIEKKKPLVLEIKHLLVPIRPPTGEPVKDEKSVQDGSKEGTQQFTLGGDVRHNPNRGKTY